MRNVVLLLVYLFSLLFLAGCTSGSVVAKGDIRESVDFSSVKIVYELPEKYEIIGIVRSSSNAGLTAQRDLDYAREELKKQAGKVGANAVLIESVSQVISRFYLPNGHSLTGKAIYIQRD